MTHYILLLLCPSSGFVLLCLCPWSDVEMMLFECYHPPHHSGTADYTRFIHFFFYCTIILWFSRPVHIAVWVNAALKWFCENPKVHSSRSSLVWWCVFVQTFLWDDKWKQCHTFKGSLIINRPRNQGTLTGLGCSQDKGVRGFLCLLWIRHPNAL